MANESLTMSSDEMLKVLPSSKGTSTLQEVTDSPANAANALVNRLTAPLVRVIDQIALTAALFLTLFSFSLAQGDNFQNFLGLRISVRNLFLEIGLIFTWRFVFWMVGLYQPRHARP